MVPKRTSDGINNKMSGSNHPVSDNNEKTGKTTINNSNGDKVSLRWKKRCFSML